MKELQEYVKKYAERGECKCGKCVDKVLHPEAKQPKGHTADLIFFKVAALEGADAATLKKLVQDSKEGTFGTVDVFDGKEHGYMELGAWIGDQGMAMMLMGLGTNLGLWKLLTPKTVLGDDLPDAMAQQMAGSGYITIQA